MNLLIPSAKDVQAALSALTLKQIDRLSTLSGVPAATIYKIKRGETKNPGIDTVRALAPHVSNAAAHITPAAPAASGTAPAPAVPA